MVGKAKERAAAKRQKVKADEATGGKSEWRLNLHTDFPGTHWANYMDLTDHLILEPSDPTKMPAPYSLCEPMVADQVTEEDGVFMTVSRVRRVRALWGDDGRICWSNAPSAIPWEKMTGAAGAKVAELKGADCVTCPYGASGDCRSYYSLHGQLPKIDDFRVWSRIPRNRTNDNLMDVVLAEIDEEGQPASQVQVYANDGTPLGDRVSIGIRVFEYDAESENFVVDSDTEISKFRLGQGHARYWLRVCTDYMVSATLNVDEEGVLHMSPVDMFGLNIQSDLDQWNDFMAFVEGNPHFPYQIAYPEDSHSDPYIFASESEVVMKVSLKDTLQGMVASSR